MTTTSGGPTAQAGSATDRQRDRETRGVRSTRSARGGDRLPSPPRQRRPALAALAVLLIVGGAALAGLLALRADSRVPVLVAAHDIAVGSQITRADLAEARIASDNIARIETSKTNLVVGRYATQSIASGQLLNAAMLGTTGFLQPGSSAVGVPLTPGRVPSSGLQSGDVVQVIHVKDGHGSVLVERAVVSSAATPGVKGGGSLGGEATSQGETATLVVDSAKAAAVAAAAADNALALVLVEHGSSTGAGG